MRPSSSLFTSISSTVSIHASVKDATSSPYLYNWLYWCFNPRICKRCDNICIIHGFVSAVSIHASVKDATNPIAPFCFISIVSIHASVKDATQACPVTCIFSSFNPRICKRCDTRLTDADSTCIEVSIHASVKDATDIAALMMGLESFQSTHL